MEEQATRRNKTLGELAAVRREAQKQTQKEDGSGSVCLLVNEESCLGFEVEMLDGTVHAFPYAAFVKLVVSPIGAVLELELNSCRIKIRGERLRGIVAPIRKGFDVTLKAIEEKYVTSVAATEPVITEIKIETDDEAPPAPPGEETPV